jgi:hypothetical protein
MGDQNDIEIAQQVYAAFGRGDIPGLLELLHPDVDWRLPGPAPYAGHHRGHAGVREFFSKLEQSVEIQHFAPRQFFGSGGAVVIGEERLRARATNRTMTQDWAHVFTIRDGKMASLRLIEDTAGHAAIFDASPETLRAQLGPMGVTEPPFGTTIPRPEE